jgi:hypothetical protein
MERLTREPGKSPFLVKGLVYNGAKDYYEGHVRGGLQAVFDQISSEPLRAFFEQRFLPSVKYDILPILPISHAAAQAQGIPQEQLVVDNARYLADQHINGIYKVLLKLSSPKRVASMLPRASIQYFDFGTARGQLLDNQTLRAIQTGVPSELASWMVWVVDGFAEVALVMAGASNVKVSLKDNPVKDGVVEGYETSALKWEIRWN